MGYVTVLRIMSGIVLLCCVALTLDQARRGHIRGRPLVLQLVGFGLWAVGLASSFVL